MYVCMYDYALDTLVYPLCVYVYMYACVYVINLGLDVYSGCGRVGVWMYFGIMHVGLSATERNPFVHTYAHAHMHTRAHTDPPTYHGLSPAQPPHALGLRAARNLIVQFKVLTLRCP